MKPEDSLVLFSLVFSMNKYEDHEVTGQDLRYLYVPKVNECQRKMYTLIIQCLSKGMKYEQIYALIENIDIEEYRILDEDAKNYVKRRIKMDLKSRENNEKIRGEIK